MKLKPFGFFRKTVLAFSTACLVLNGAGGLPVFGEPSPEKAVVETDKFPETEALAHPEQITRNGILLKLVRAEPHKTTEKNRKTRASCERERDSSEEEHPDSWNVSLKDPVTKRQVSDIIPYVRTYDTTVFWEDDLFFEMTLKETGTDLVVFGSKTFPCNEEEPVPEDLYDDVLRSVGLDPEAAKITSVTWKKGVNSDGTRTAYVEGKTCHRMVKDVFEGEVKLPDITMVSYTLYYEEPEADFLKRTGKEAASGTSAAPPSESRSSASEPSETGSSVPESSVTQSSASEPSETQSSAPEPSETQSSAPEPSGSEKTELASSAVPTPTTETTASQKTEAVENTEDSASGETRGKTDSSEETGSSEEAALTLSEEETDPDENSETGETAAADGTSEPAGTGETGGTSENAENTGSAGLPLKGIIAGVSGIAGTLGLGALGVLFLQYRKKR